MCVYSKSFQSCSTLRDPFTYPQQHWLVLATPVDQAFQANFRCKGFFGIRQFLFYFFLIFQTLHNCISFEKYVTPWTISQPGSFCPWVSPGMRTGGGCHILLQGIFPTQGSNPHLLQLLHRQAGSFTTSTNCLKPQN